MGSDLARAFTHTLTSSPSEVVDRQRATSILAAGWAALWLALARGQVVSLCLAIRPARRLTIFNCPSRSVQHFGAGQPRARSNAPGSRRGWDSDPCARSPG